MKKENNHEKSYVRLYPVRFGVRVLAIHYVS